MDIKSQVRVLAIDDSQKRKPCYLIGVIYRGSKYFDGILFEKITPDGLDSTEKIIKMVRKSKRTDIRYILLDGITYGGFNIVDIHRLFNELKIPIIVFMYQYPNFPDIEKALKNNFSDWKDRLDLIYSAGKIYEIELNGIKRYFQVVGTTPRKIKLLLRKITVFGGVPEPLRVANIIARSLKIDL